MIRRTFLAAAALLNADSGEARISARPRKPGNPAPAGTYTLGLRPRRDALLYIPPELDSPAPMLVCLHGAGGDGRRSLALFEPFAAERRIALLAPSSRDRTWDFLLGGFGPDVATLNRALEAAFDLCAVDAGRLAIGGFSDGASYALSAGLANGDLFAAILAYSPGFAAPPAIRGWPAVFVSHGTRDPVLPIDRCSRPLVARLKNAGYRVSYREFDGPHTVPPDIAHAGLDLLVPRG